MAIDAVNASTEFAVPDANRPPQSFSFLLGKLFRVLHDSNEYALSNAAASAGEFIFEFSIFNLALPRPTQSPQPQSQGIQANKTLGVALMINLIRFECRHVWIVKRSF